MVKLNLKPTAISEAVCIEEGYFVNGNILPCRYGGIVARHRPFQHISCLEAICRTYASASYRRWHGVCVCRCENINTLTILIFCFSTVDIHTALRNTLSIVYVIEGFVAQVTEYIVEGICIKCKDKLNLGNK